jgi:hypothetical protein
MVVYRITKRHSDGTSVSGKLFKVNVRSVYKEMLFGTGIFHFLLSLLVHFDSKQSYDFGNILTFVFALFHRYEF